MVVFPSLMVVFPSLMVVLLIADKKDREHLVSGLEGSKEVLQNVNMQVERAELAMRLQDISNRLDNRSFAIHRGKKFRVSWE